MWCWSWHEGRNFCLSYGLWGTLCRTYQQGDCYFCLSDGVCVMLSGTGVLNTRQYGTMELRHWGLYSIINFPGGAQSVYRYLLCVHILIMYCMVQNILWNFAKLHKTLLVLHIYFSRGGRRQFTLIYTCQICHYELNIINYKVEMSLAHDLRKYVDLNSYPFWCWNQNTPGYHGCWWCPGGRLNKKDGLTRYGDSHVKDKTS